MSSSSNTPTYRGTPYDPWGKYNVNGGWIGPVHASPTQEYMCCDPYDPAGECYCDPTDPSSECYEPDNCDPNDPSSLCWVDPQGPPEDEYGPGGSGSGGSGGGNGGSLRVPKPRIDNTAVANTLHGQAARVREGSGQISMVEKDLSIGEDPVWDTAPTDQMIFESTQFPWGQSRSYANIEGPEEGGLNGNCWLNKELGYIDFLGAAPGVANPDRIVRSGLANESIWFEKDQSTNLYSPLTAFYGQLLHEGDTFVYSNEQGMQWIYYDNSVSHPAEMRGRLKALRTPYGTTTLAEYDVNDELERVAWPPGASENGVINSFVYEYYDTIEHIGMLKSVTQRYLGKNYRKVEYEYYGAADANGNQNDLKKAVISGFFNYDSDQGFYSDSGNPDGTWVVLRDNYYRYYKEGQTGGFKHGLKYVLRAKAYDQMVAAGITPETASDTDIATYADYYFEYDSSFRVTKQKVRGGTETLTYSYENNPDEPGLEDKNTWDTLTTVTDPDGTDRRVYTNATSSVIVSVFDDNAGNVSYNAMTRNSDGWTDQRAYPTAISSVTEPGGGSTDLIVNYNEDEGLIYEYKYYTTTNPATGAVKGRPESRSTKKGSQGTADLLDKTLWSTQAAGSADVYPVLKKIKYPEGGAGTPSDYDVTRTFYKDDEDNDTLQVEKEVKLPPVVPVSQNGDGVQHEIITYFNKLGGRTWRKDARGYITHWQYGTDGTLLRRIDDVNTSVVEGAPDGWTTPAGGGLNLETDYERDASGRILRGLGPWNSVVLHEDDEKATNVRGVDFYVYRPDIGEEWSAVGYATGSATAYGYDTVGEVTITRRDKQKRITDVIAAVRECSCGALKENEEFPQSNWEGWTKNYYDEWGRLLVKRVYHNIPKIGEGKKGEHYGETKYSYDVMGNQIRQVSPGGTITRTVIDSRGLTTSSWVGTNDNGATDSDPTGGGAAGNNMVKVLALEYDNGQSGGNGLLTKETRPVDEVAANDRITEYSYDYRTWLEETKTNDGVTDYFTTYTYSNYGQITMQQSYHSSVVAGNLTGQYKTYFDSLGRAYKEETYAVNPDTGAVGNALRSETWRDANGNIIKKLAQGSEAFSKTVYDGLNRPIENYLAYNAGTSSNDNDVSNDVVVEQTETNYNVKGKVIQSTFYQRFDDATGNGTLNGPNGTQPKARRSFSCIWYDGIHRIVAEANFGTCGGADFTRPVAVPERSDTVLINSYRYLTDGEADATIDPNGIENRWEKDAAGRITVLIENFDPKEPAQDYGANRITAYGYNADGQQETLTLVNQVTGDQITHWVYGTTLTDSGVARNDLLRAKIYPESNDEFDPLGDGPDGVYERIEYQYNRQGNQIQMKDPNGTIHDYDFDKMGRQTQDRITTFAEGIDDTVKRIATEYDTRGLPYKVTSYDHATVGSGNVINQVEYGYDDFGSLNEDKQSHSGVTGGGTPKVSYIYEDGSSSNTVRRKSITYPDGRVVEIGYGTASSGDDLMSRPASIKINGESNNLVDYTFLGYGVLAKAEYPEPGIDLSYMKTASQPLGDAGDPYTGYDRFGRVVDMRWATSSGGTIRDGFQYGYDRSSRRTWRSNLAAASGDNQDEHYLYDGLNQVTGASRGELNINRTAIGAIPASEETFSYDPTGNWDRYVKATDGTTDLDQTRVNNKDNQITQFDGSSGNTAYDKAGNATKMSPDKNGDWAEYYHLKWDGWNRLVEVKDSTDEVVATYGYDGTTRRITKTIDSNVRHYYYNDEWKTVEERVAASTSAANQYAWGLRSRNDLILLDRDTTGNGTLDERLYATKDAMGSGTALVDTGGNVVERYGYTAFGIRRIMAPDFSDRTASSYDWEFAFHGEFLDGETGFVNYGYRYYIPNIGRWISRDPIEEDGGTNLYSFVSNNPINNSDLMGRDIVDEIARQLNILCKAKCEADGMKCVASCSLYLCITDLTVQECIEGCFDLANYCKRVCDGLF